MLPGCGYLYGVEWVCVGRSGEVAKKCGDEVMAMIEIFVSVFSAPCNYATFGYTALKLDRMDTRIGRL